jgi:hypothetical protein
MSDAVGLVERRSSSVIYFDAPRDAEPEEAPTAPSGDAGGGDADKPTVLSKLQKWVSDLCIYSRNRAFQSPAGDPLPPAVEPPPDTPPFWGNSVCRPTTPLWVAPCTLHCSSP